ncbi:topoisomerase C-terminal repeat-containing protein, partial [Corynebacterium casei]
GKPMSVKDGRFGPYVTDGTTNASLRKGDSPETLTDQRANELLSERRAKQDADGGAAKKTTKKATKSSAKKTTKKATKSTAKKSTKRATKKPSPATKNVVKAGSRRK